MQWLNFTVHTFSTLSTRPAQPSWCRSDRDRRIHHHHQETCRPSLCVPCCSWIFLGAAQYYGLYTHSLWFISDFKAHNGSSRSEIRNRRSCAVYDMFGIWGIYGMWYKTSTLFSYTLYRMPTKSPLCLYEDTWVSNMQVIVDSNGFMTISSSWSNANIDERQGTGVIQENCLIGCAYYPKHAPQCFYNHLCQCVPRNGLETLWMKFICCSLLQKKVKTLCKITTVWVQEISNSF